MDNEQQPVIVVGIDRSDTARLAAFRAAEIASALNGRLHVITCVDPTTSIDVSVGSEAYHSDWISEAEQFVQDVVRTLPCDRITHKVMRGDPARALCDEAEALGADAIVVGNRRVQGLSRVLGSVAAGVTHHAPCDVVVAHTTGSVARREQAHGATATSE